MLAKIDHSPRFYPIMADLVVSQGNLFPGSVSEYEQRQVLPESQYEGELDGYPEIPPSQ